MTAVVVKVGVAESRESKRRVLVLHTTLGRRDSRSCDHESRGWDRDSCRLVATVKEDDLLAGV
jgi:hypothetical protein